MTRQGRRFCSRSLSWIGNNNQAISCSKNNSKVVKLLASRVLLPWAVFLLFIQNLRNNYAPPRVKRGGGLSEVTKTLLRVFMMFRNSIRITCACGRASCTGLYCWINS